MDSQARILSSISRMFIGENRNWSANLAVPLSEWNHEVSCCRDGIVILRVIESTNIIVTTAFAVIMIRILRKTKVNVDNIEIFIDKI